jgi:hypothetical protein
MTPMRGIAIVLCGVLLQTPVPASAQDDPARRLARDIFEELIEINTVTATGDTLRAAEAMAARLTSAGFADADVQVLSPAPRKGNLVARLRGTGARRPLLLLAHLDVVEARREDWSRLPDPDGADASTALPGGGVPSPRHAGPRKPPDAVDRREQQPAKHSGMEV